MDTNPIKTWPVKDGELQIHINSISILLSFFLATWVLEDTIQSEFWGPHWWLFYILRVVRTTLLHNLVQVFASFLYCLGLKKKIRYKNSKAVKEEWQQGSRMSKIHITVIEYINLNFLNSERYCPGKSCQLKVSRSTEMCYFWEKFFGCYESKIFCNIISNSSFKRISCLFT